MVAHYFLDWGDSLEPYWTSILSLTAHTKIFGCAQDWILRPPRKPPDPSRYFVTNFPITNLRVNDWGDSADNSQGQGIICGRIIDGFNQYIEYYFIYVTFDPETYKILYRSEVRPGDNISAPNLRVDNWGDNNTKSDHRITHSTLDTDIRIDYKIKPIEIINIDKLLSQDGKIYKTIRFGAITVLPPTTVVKIIMSVITATITVLPILMATTVITDTRVCTNTGAYSNTGLNIFSVTAQ